MQEPLPKSRAKMRGHAMYVIKPDLRVTEAIWPQKPVLGFCEGFPVYLRSCVKQLKTADMWLRVGKQAASFLSPSRRQTGDICSLPCPSALVGAWSRWPIVSHSCWPIGLSRVVL